MGFTALRCEGGISGLFLADGAKVVPDGGEAADDLARIVVTNVADKVFRSAGKRFSHMTLVESDGETSAWDAFCRNAFHDGGVTRWRIVSDFLRQALVREIDAMSNELRWVIELTACDGVEDDEEETLNRMIVLAVVYAELTVMIQDHGRALSRARAGAAQDDQPIVNGASPL